MQLRSIKNPYRSAGFTLLEVAIAVAILGVGLTTIMAIQTRYQKQYQREESLADAALIAQYAMTMMEVSKNQVPLNPGTVSGDLADLLDKISFFEGEDLSSLSKRIEGWTYSLTITSIDLPAIGDSPPKEDVLRRVDLAIKWSPDSRDEFNLTYYIRMREQAQSAPPP